MNVGTAEWVLKHFAERQERRDGGHEHTPLKVGAKRRAAEIVLRYGGTGRVLDVGGEDWYWPHFVGCECEDVNLPNDMHALDVVGRYDGALAMHVLEHSPFPALVMENIRRALKPGGWLYVAVPHPTSLWIPYTCHVTMMPPDAWEHLFRAMGWEVLHREDGRFGRAKRSREERFFLGAK